MICRNEKKMLMTPDYCPVKVFRTITHNMHIIARDVLYPHGMSRLHVVFEKHLQRQ